MGRAGGVIDFTVRDFLRFSQTGIRPELAFISEAMGGIDNSGYGKGRNLTDARDASKLIDFRIAAEKRANFL